MIRLTSVLCILTAASVFAQAPPPAPVDAYPLHADGGIIYDPLRREAEKTGRLARYEAVQTRTHRVELDGFTLEADVPVHAAAYDVAPIPYRLTWEGEKAARFPVAVEAVAFQDTERAEGHVFDLAMPNRIELDVELLGSITADLDPEERHNLAPDDSDTPKTYPPFTRKPMVRSGVIEAGDLVWLKFKYTNTGDTIIDPEGYGGALFFPALQRKGEDGAWVTMGGLYNMYARDTTYLYPGESREIWFQCTSNWPGFDESKDVSGTPQGFGLAPGDYRLRINLVFRCYATDEPLLNIWEGASAFVYEQPFAVKEEPEQAPVPAGRVDYLNETDKRTTFIHTFEEFMTAFDCHLTPPAGGGRTVEGALHLQVAPWTEHVTLKLIAGNPVEGASATIPLNVDASQLQVVFDPDHPGVFVEDGLTHPVIESQTMADMRTNIQIGPYPERHIRERMEEMMDCGVNVVATTSMPWLYTDFFDNVSNYQGDAMKYALDVARDLGMRVEGWGTYPFDRSPVEQHAELILGEDIPISDYTLGGHYISHAEPGLPKANAVVWLYQFNRWGDLYHQDLAGRVPISVEDTRGWMRQDINIRYEMGQATIDAFRQWLEDKYGDIASVNEAWETDFASFGEIDPEKDQVRNRFGHIWEYTDPSNPFHDWSAAVTDLDRFRTELRMRNYADTLKRVREAIPNAVICLRTEGGNVFVQGVDPTDPNPHMRHIYYSQRRCGAVAEILQSTGDVAYHSDYTTMPYTPSELRELVARSVEQGIIPAYFPQFDNMRDIAINARYGTDYQVHYNLPQPKKGYMMHTLVALYPWFKAVYEAGGVPGILWEDLQCDGFATVTQKREMRLFKKRLQAALSTPEALAVRAERAQDAPSQAWRENAAPMRSYVTER